MAQTTKADRQEAAKKAAATRERNRIRKESRDARHQGRGQPPVERRAGRPRAGPPHGRVRGRRLRHRGEAGRHRRRRGRQVGRDPREGAGPPLARTQGGGPQAVARFGAAAACVVPAGAAFWLARRGTSGQDEQGLGRPAAPTGDASRYDLRPSAARRSARGQRPRQRSPAIPAAGRRGREWLRLSARVRVALGRATGVLTGTVGALLRVVGYAAAMLRRAGRIAVSTYLTRVGSSFVSSMFVHAFLVSRTDPEAV